MAEVVRNSAETTLKGLYSRNPAVAESARRQVERLSAEELMRLLHQFETRRASARLRNDGKYLAATLLIIFGGLVGGLVYVWKDPAALLMGILPLGMILLLWLPGILWRSRDTEEDHQRVESSLRDLLKKTQSPSSAEAAALLLYKQIKQEQADTRYEYSSVFTQAAHQALLRILPGLETAQGWKSKGRQALFDLMQDDTYEHKLVFCILDTVARWRDVDALPQLSKLTKREDRPMPLRRHANEVMTLLLAERQKRQVGEGLLRASEAPQGHSRQELLRPAAGYSETLPEQLLRPQA